MRLAAWSLATLFTIVLAPACSGKYTTIPDPGAEQSKVFDCSDYLACDVNAPCDLGGECLAISGCGSAICVSASVVCDQACGSTQCGVAASYPGQIPSCPDGTPIKGKGTGESVPMWVGTGGGPSYAGSAPVTGGYATAGFNSGGYATAGSPSGGYAGFPNTVSVNCQVYSRCNANVACAGAGFDCIAVPGCQLGICAPAFTLCENLCAGACTVLESYPVQLQCSSNKISGYEGFAGSGGSSHGGSPQGYAGEDFGGFGGYAGFGGDFAGGAGGSP